MATATLTADQLNAIAKQSGYTGGTFSSTGLSTTPTIANSSLGLNTPTAQTTPTGVPQPISTQQPNPATVNSTPYTYAGSDAYYQKMADSNPEAADVAMTKAGYGPAQPDPNINQAWQLGTYDQRTKLAQQYGIQNYTGTADQNTQLLQKYRSAFQTAQQSGQQAPTTSGAGSKAINDITGGASPIPSVNPLDTILAQDKGYQDLLKTYQDFTSNQKQQESLTSTYDRLTKEAGIEGIDTQLLNAKKIIDGTEQDIRNEVSAVGGFATESQVQALAGARNKALIQNYNTLLQTRDNALNRINTMVGLTAQDRQYAQQQFENQLNIQGQLQQYRDKFISNAKEGYNAIINKAGYAGLYDSVKNDPNALALVEKTLGLGQGGLAQLATQKTDEWSSPYILGGNYVQKNNKTGEIRTASSIPSSQLGGGTQVTPNYKGEFAATIDLISNTGTTNDQRNNIKSTLQNFIGNGDYGSAYALTSQAVANALKGQAGTKFQEQVSSLSVLSDLQKAIQSYSQAGGSTNIFKGTADQIQTKIGQLYTDPKYAALAVQLDTAFQNYRLQMTGAAFGPKESAEYASVLPAKGNTLDLNLAKIAGAKNYLNSSVEGSIRSVVGEGGINIKQRAELGGTGEVISTGTTSSGIGYKIIQ